MRRRPNESGQATIEFALTLILLMSYVMFYLQLAMVFAWGNYVHYATFMSARALLSAGPDTGDQLERSRAVIVRMLKRGESAAGVDRFPMIAKGVGGGDPGGYEAIGGADLPGSDRWNNKDLSWQFGVRYKFRSRIFVIPMGRAGGGAPAGGAGPGGVPSEVNAVTLISESYLGKEPTFEDCTGTDAGGLGSFPGFFDNGC